MSVASAPSPNSIRWLVIAALIALWGQLYLAAVPIWRFGEYYSYGWYVPPFAVFFFYRSRMGVAMRAVAYDQEAAMAQGINVGRVFAIAWAAGAMLAAIGVIFATQPPVKQTGAVDPDVANIAFRALPAVVLGGLDSATGALVGGILIGLAEIFAGQYASGFQNELGPGYPLIIPYLVMIIGLLVRPYGLFGTPEIRRV